MRAWVQLAFLYLLGTLVFLWPIPAQLGDAVWGARFDAWTTLWLIGHLAERLEAGNFSATTNEILYPLGYNLWSFGHIALQGLGAVLVKLGISVVAAYNLLLILGVWTSAMAAHLLGKELTGLHIAGAVSGIVFGASPYLYAEGSAGCIELVAAGLLPLHAWSMVRLLRLPSWRRCLVATGVLAIIGPFNWYYTLFAGLFALGFIAWRVIALRGRLWTPTGAAHRRGLGLLILSLGLAALTNLPFIDAAKQETPDRPAISAERFSDADAWDRATTISEGRASLEELTEEALIELDALQVHLNSTSVLDLTEAEFSVNPLGITPGWLAYGIAFLALLVSGRQVWGWLGLGVGFTVLSMGPHLNLDGSLILPLWATEWSMPYRWAADGLPFFEKAYRPYRFAVVVLQCAAVMGAIGMASLGTHTRSNRARLAVLILGAVAFSQPLWQEATDRPTHTTEVPGLYTALSTAPRGAVIEVPLQYQPISIAIAQQQYFQLTHGHPVINTNQLIRRPDLLAFKDYVAANSFLRGLLDLGRPDWPIEVADEDIDALVDEGFRYIVLRDRVTGDTEHLAGEVTRANLVGEAGRMMLTSLLGQPAFSTDDGHVYDLQLADTQTGRVRSFTDTGIVTLTPAFDIMDTGLSLTLGPGQDTLVFEGTAQQLSLWAIGPSTQDLSLVVDHDGETERQTISLEDGFWRRYSFSLPSGPVRVTVEAGQSGVSAALTQMEIHE